MPLIDVQHNDDGTSSYTFGEPEEVPTGEHESSGGVQATDYVHGVGILEPSVSHTDAEQSEPQLSTDSSESHIQQQHADMLGQSLDGSSIAEPAHRAASGSTSGDGALAGIPPPRRAYTMPTPRELQDQLDSVNVHSHSNQTHVDVPDAQFRDSSVNDAAHQDTERDAWSSAEGDAAPRTSSLSSQGFVKMSHVGKAFCQALGESNLVSAVAIAHVIEEHGYVLLCQPIPCRQYSYSIG